MTLALTLAQSDAPSKSLLEYIAAGGPIGAIIIVLSLAAVALVVTQLLRVRLTTLAPAESVEALDHTLSSGDVKSAEAFCEDPVNASFLTRVVGSALLRCDRSPFGFLELRSALEEAGQRETARLYRFTDAIGLIASVAPMLGLLGTVVGMVGAFDTITLTDGPARPDQLAGNISVALVTTVLGLIVAIPCTAAYTFLRNRIDALTSEIAEIIEDLAAHLEGTAAPASPKAPRA
ncbi:MAG: MotA/TolQ/ExbB proton channel family protein [Phycisphaerales bacterium]